MNLYRLFASPVRGARSVLFAAILCFAALVAPPARAQAGRCLRRIVYASVINRKGQIVEDADLGDLRGSYRGKPVRIVSYARDLHPRRVLVLLDASASMAQTRDFTFNVADELLDQLPQGTEVGAMIFAQHSTPVPVLTTDRQSVHEDLEAWRNDKRLNKDLKDATALLSAIERSLPAFGKPQVGDTIYVISDGDDNVSNLKWRALDETLLARGIRVFALRILWTGYPLEGIHTDLPDMVTSTGGSAVVVPLDYFRYMQSVYNPRLRDPSGKPSRLAQEIELQVRLTLNFGRIVIELPEPAKDPATWELRFAKPSKDFFLGYQHDLPPCLAPGK